MLIPPEFSVASTAGLHHIISSYPLGVLVTPTTQGLDVNHIPFELNPSGSKLGVLTGHVARANPVWQPLAGASRDVLVIFRGSQGYISPGWYPSKKETHRFVPTWNYEVVHARGKLLVHDDERFLRGVLARLTRRHEAKEATPWKMGDAPLDYLSAMVKAVVGIEIVIDHLEGMSKLSQNRETRDFDGAVKALRHHGDEGLAGAMTNAFTRT
ncbi:MAG: FMN-binding negative transcriptional regulator [Polaromonas sp.]